MRLLHPGGAQVLQDGGGEILLPVVAEAGVRHPVDQFVVLIHAQNAVRRQALHREGAGHPHLPAILVGLVIEVFVIRLGRDGGVDLPLPGNALPPPLPVQGTGRRFPRVGGTGRQRIQVIVPFEVRVEVAQKALHLAVVAELACPQRSVGMIALFVWDMHCPRHGWLRPHLGVWMIAFFAGCVS